MSVILITGQPGSGKTALCVDMLAYDKQFEGRPIFVMGIPDLTIDHTPCPPVNQWTENRLCPEDETKELSYFTFPENALVVIDEAQRIYRPRPVGSKVPPEVAAFETHRHTGIDFVLLTQHAGLIDSNIRKLIGKHIHIRATSLGRYKYEWPEIGDPDSSSSRDIAAKEKYKPPARAFKLYKSSELHTKIKHKLPWFVYLFGICLISVVVLAGFAYQRISAKTDQKVTEKIDLDKQGGKAKDGVRSNTEYLLDSVPRMPALIHTAPKYDEITKAIDAPWPVGCMISHRPQKDLCRCIDQTGNSYPTSDEQCKQIVKNGIFKDWNSPEKQKAEPQQVRQTPQGDGATGEVSPVSIRFPTEQNPTRF